MTTDHKYQIVSNQDSFLSEINEQILWDFYVKSGFIYPEKLEMLTPFKQEILNTFNKILSCKDNTFKIFVAIKNRSIIGSIMASQFTDNTWVVQHLSVMPEHRLSSVAKNLLLAVNSRMMNNEDMSYFQNYFRPSGKRRPFAESCCVRSRQT